MATTCLRISIPFEFELGSQDHDEYAALLTPTSCRVASGRAQEWSFPKIDYGQVEDLLAAYTRALMQHSQYLEMLRLPSSPAAHVQQSSQCPPTADRNGARVALYEAVCNAFVHSAAQYHDLCKHTCEMYCADCAPSGALDDDVSDASDDDYRFADAADRFADNFVWAKRSSFVQREKSNLHMADALRIRRELYVETVKMRSRGNAAALVKPRTRGDASIEAESGENELQEEDFRQEFHARHAHDISIAASMLNARCALAPINHLVVRRLAEQELVFQRRARVMFHGTNSLNIPSIMASGLMIAGKNGLKVRNGQAYGQGVYTSPSPHFASGYGTVLVCAVVDPITPPDKQVPFLRRNDMATPPKRQVRRGRSLQFRATRKPGQAGAPSSDARFHPAENDHARAGSPLILVLKQESLVAPLFILQRPTTQNPGKHVLPALRELRARQRSLAIRRRERR